MASVSTSSPSVDDIRRSMAQIRQRLHEDMQGVVAGAEAASDWKHYVRMYPIPALAVAAVSGYLIVPRKRRSVTKTAERAAEAAISKLVEVPVPPPVMAAEPFVPPPKKSGLFGSLFGSVFGMVTPILMKAAQNYVLNHVGTLMEQMEQAAGPPPEPEPVIPIRPKPTSYPSGR